MVTSPAGVCRALMVELLVIGSRAVTAQALKRPQKLNFTGVILSGTTDVGAAPSRRGSARRPREVGANPTRCRHCKRGALFPVPGVRSCISTFCLAQAQNVEIQDLTPNSHQRHCASGHGKARKQRVDPPARISGAGPSFSLGARHAEKEPRAYTLFARLALLLPFYLSCCALTVPRRSSQPAKSSIRTAAAFPARPCC